MRIVEAMPLLTIGVYNCDGELFAIEDPVLPRRRAAVPEAVSTASSGWRSVRANGARFDIETGRALTLPAYIAVEAFPVRVRDDGIVVVDA